MALSTPSKLIVAIDTGSTTFTVAYRWSGKTVTYLVNEWPGYVPQSRDMSGSAPPTILYFPHGREPPWQREVDMEEDTSEDFDLRRKVVNFKSGLDIKNGPSYEVLNATARYIGTSVENFAHTFTDLLLNYLFFDDQPFFCEYLQGGLKIEDITLVFAKPPGWAISTYDSFRLAALSLGFSNEQIKFISETEALMRAFFSTKVTESEISKLLQVCPFQKQEAVLI
ncbi:uncharacterized protein LY89DRAFT_472726 [Mollisia scopiformis]|uniref:Uncharacterized protein n=1 Tax=Mollisia scopiformis TaxID=149040 RepID=A0A194XK40_MOLSC|nr:uncharacterized protein LY89DRAFT_472726 [Mollisia scopiformis]KUJ20157.1 hypothetical protein LY89DRAFT_472726 [Mollisia scopiformis]